MQNLKKGQIVEPYCKLIFININKGYGYGV